MHVQLLETDPKMTRTGTKVTQLGLTDITLHCGFDPPAGFVCHTSCGLACIRPDLPLLMENPSKGHLWPCPDSKNVERKPTPMVADATSGLPAVLENAYS